MGDEEEVLSETDEEEEVVGAGEEGEEGWEEDTEDRVVRRRFGLTDDDMIHHDQVFWFRRCWLLMSKCRNERTDDKNDKMTLKFRLNQCCAAGKWQGCVAYALIFGCTRAL